MSIGLILGRAGSGKTEACIEQIRRGLSVATDEEYILLTPEQATFANEKRILATLGNAAGFQVKVLSFRRFVHRVLQETGGGLRPVLDNVGMSLVLRSILERNLEKLAAFGRVWDKSGFIRRLAELITELRVYQVDPDEMLAKIGDLLPESDLSSKISDIHWILREYEMFLSKGWLDLSGELALLCQKLPEWPRFSKACFWLDGFHGFTPAEFGVIRCLLAAGRPVKVTLNLPANTLERELEEDELFYPTWDTASELRDMCRDYGYEMIPPIYMGDPGEGRFAGSPSLARLERALAVREEVADPSGMPGGSGSPGTHGETQGEAHGETSGESQSETPSETPWETQGEIDGWRYGEYAAIRLSGCGDMRQEVERMAVEIVEAARDEGFRYKDMAVLIRRPEVYEGLIHSILPSYGIPYFMDRPKPLRYHPLVVLIREIAAFLRDQWNTGTLMAYMKTGLTGLTDNQGYALENYCLAYGIQRMHWESPRPWSFSPPQQPEREAVDIYMEGLRQKLWRPLVVLRKSIDVADSTEDIVSNVFQHLSALNAKEACNRLAEESVRCGEPEGAQIHQRAWQEVMKLFDQTVTFLGQDEISDADAKMVAAVWESGLDSLEAAAVPPSLDQVTICSMDRSRSPLAIKVWILGANEGVIPANIKDDSLLNTEERAWLAEHRIRLAPDSRRRLFSEEYLAYIALTRASGSLHISYARADIQGAAQAPSVLLERICRVFPGLQIDEADLTAPRWLIKPAIALPFLGLALRNGNQDQEGMYPSEGWNARDSEGLWRYVYHWFGSRQEHKRDLERLKVAFDLAPLGQALSAELAERLFGHTIKTSVTRLEQFQACPFSHFLGYGLALEPREIYDIQPPEIGNFFHDSLEALLKDIKAEGIAMSLLSGEDLQRKVATIAEKQFDDSKNAIFRATAWYSRLSANLHRMLASSAAALAWQEGQGIFQPHAMEVGFGFGDPESLPPVTLDLGHGRKILLRGRIDRIDRAIHPGSGQPYMRIIDYKSGNLDLSLHEIYHGVKLQLILYLEAAKAAYPEAKTAGLFYFRVHDPILTAETVPEALDGAWRETRLMESQGLHGYLLGDSEVIQMMDRDYAASLFLPVSTIKSGEFSKRSRLLSEEDFRILGGHSRRMLSEAGQRIMEGDISLSPHLTKGKSACTYCLYRSVCRFDTAVPGHNYRWLPGLSDDTVLKRLKSMRKGEGAYDGLE